MYSAWLEDSVMVQKQGKEGLRVPSSELGFLRIWVLHPKHIQIVFYP